MAPFIQAKREDLYAGAKNIDSNPTGAFDTNGWGELRVRLPKFAHGLSPYAAAKRKVAFPREKAARLREMATDIVQECDRMLVWMEEKHGKAGGEQSNLKTR